ncbi:MAG: hypothetical protein RR426_03330, partial [Oscillospiraceae bacterium]
MGNSMVKLWKNQLFWQFPPVDGGQITEAEKTAASTGDKHCQGGDRYGGWLATTKNRPCISRGDSLFFEDKGKR